MDAEVGVIGLGTMGSMTLWQLAKKGISAIGFEQFGIGHDMSAAGGESRLFRTIYKEGLGYVPLIKQSYELWKDLEKESKRELLKITSGLIIGDLKLNSMRNALKSIEAHDLDFEILHKEDAEIRFPQHKLQPDESIIVDKLAGYIRPQLAIISAVERAKELGAIVRTYSKVDNVKPKGNGVLIRTQDEEYKVKKVIVAAGPWSQIFSEKINSVVGVRRLVNCWFFPKENSNYTERHFLPFTRDKGNVSYYGFPSIDNQMVKLGIFSSEKEEIVEPSFMDKNIKIEELDPFINLVEKDIPGLHKFPSRVGTYMDSFTRDKHPLIGKLHRTDPIYFLTGFSGHGFKMAPVYGKIASEIVLENDGLKHPISLFSPNRFFRD